MKQYTLSGLVSEYKSVVLDGNNMVCDKRYSYGQKLIHVNEVETIELREYNFISPVVTGVLLVIFSGVAGIGSVSLLIGDGTVASMFPFGGVVEIVVSFVCLLLLFWLSKLFGELVISTGGDRVVIAGRRDTLENIVDGVSGRLSD